MRLKLWLICLLAVFPASGFVRAADNPPDLGHTYNYFQGKHYVFRGDAPYLNFFKNEIEIRAFARAGKRDAVDAALDMRKDGGKSVSQINFITEVCGYSIGHGVLRTDLLPVLEKQKQRLNQDLAAAVDGLFKENIPADFFRSLKNGDMYRGSAFSIKYQESEAYCDATGGTDAIFKLFVARR